MNRQQEIEKINYPVALHTVDILVIRRDIKEGTFFLLGRKSGQTKFQIPGGFVDPTDTSTERAACRELLEETGIVIMPSLTSTGALKQLQYEGSFKIDDERYRNSVHKIITSFYTVEVGSLDITPIASDDLEELKWFHIGSEDDWNTLLSQTVQKHHILLKSI